MAKIMSVSEALEKLKKDNQTKAKQRKELQKKLGDNIRIVDSKSRYSLKGAINKYIKEHRLPVSASVSWLWQEVFKKPEIYKHNSILMRQGHLYMFEYFDPKYKHTKYLPYFDKFPLVISLGIVQTKLGIRNIGLNLHLVPPKIRVIMLLYIFEIQKKIYRYLMVTKARKPSPITWQMLAKPLLKYGALFCIRMYIPNRQKHLIEFPISDWYKAIFIPSRGYDGIRAAELIKEWKLHLSRLGYASNPNLKW